MPTDSAPVQPALPQTVFRTIAVLVVVLTVGWWRDLLPVESWLALELNPLTLAGLYVLTTLLHGGGFHLMFNLYWVNRFAPWMEARWGPLPLALGYLWLAFGTGGIELLLDQSGIGLSGLVYGVVGFLWFADRDLPESHKLVRWTDVQFFTGWFFLCIAITWLGLLNVGNVAHGSGAALGSILGLATRWPRPAQIALGVGVPVLSLLVVYAL